MSFESGWVKVTDIRPGDEFLLGASGWPAEVLDAGQMGDVMEVSYFTITMSGAKVRNKRDYLLDTRVWVFKRTLYPDEC